jgi:hypothetical protein
MTPRKTGVDNWTERERHNPRFKSGADLGSLNDEQTVAGIGKKV